MKKTLCLLISVVMLLGILPSVVFADYVPINEVKIKDLDYPVVGRAFDYNFSLPDVYTSYYEKDVSVYASAVVWYDLGLDGSWMNEMDASDVPQSGHFYMAEIYLQNAGSSEMAEFNYTHGRFASSVSVIASVYPENKVLATNGVVDSDSRMRARITFTASSVFDPLHGVIIDLDSFPTAGDTPLTHVPTSIQAPDYFSIKAEWFLKGQNYSSVSPLADDYTFKPGKEYNLRVILDCGPKGIFSDEAYVTIANLIPDSVVAEATRLVADISFAVPITIEGIRAPHYFEAPQTDGFTSNADVDVFGNWFCDDPEYEFPQPYTGSEFVMGYVYYLQLRLSSKTAESLAYLTEDLIELNYGKIHGFTVNGDDVIITLQIAIEPDEMVIGDVNGDGKLNAKDVTALMKYLVGVSPYPFFLANADFNNDGKVNAKDVTSLMKFLISPKG